MLLSDFVFALDNTVNNRGDYNARMEQWRRGNVKLCPKDVCDRIQSGAKSADKQVERALDRLPGETTGLVSSFLPVDTLNEAISSTFGDNLGDSMSRTETAKAIKKSMIEDGLTAAVTRKTWKYILIPMLIFGLTAGVLALDSRRHFSA